MGMTLCTSANPSALTEVAPGLQRPGRSGPLVLGCASRRRPAGGWPSARGWAAAVPATASPSGRWKPTR
jgi:hypothetical protein